MSLSVFLKIKSGISLVFGVGMLLLTPWMVPLYGVSLSPVGTLLAQWNGAFLIGVGLICWFAGTAPRTDLLRGVLLALFICDSIGFVTSLLAQLGGHVNVLGWSSVGFWLLLALGLGYFLLFGREE